MFPHLLPSLSTFIGFHLPEKEPIAINVMERHLGEGEIFFWPMSNILKFKARALWQDLIYESLYS